MEDSTSSDRKKSARWTAALLVVLAAVGFLADVTGLFGFITGKSLPELSAPSSAAPVIAPGDTGSARTGVSPTRESPATSPGPPPGTRASDVVREPPRQSAPVDTKPVTTTNAVKNFQLGVNPGEFDAATPRMIVIETSDGGLGTFVDVEIADPSASGGVCPKLTTGPCNLVYSGGSEADGSGRSLTEFEWFGNAPGHDNIHHPGRYTVTVQDRGTGAKVSIDFTAR
ncbi:hypothetical protein PV646_29400 [Streptomyces sp. ID05-26A]|nr:hypothetical protein [Streptomyces sp. ID05-26A]